MNNLVPILCSRRSPELKELSILYLCGAGYTVLFCEVAQIDPFFKKKKKKMAKLLFNLAEVVTLTLSIFSHFRLILQGKTQRWHNGLKLGICRRAL